jgi:hypothetical protein
MSVRKDIVHALRVSKREYDEYRHRAAKAFSVMLSNPTEPSRDEPDVQYAGVVPTLPTKLRINPRTLCDLHRDAVAQSLNLYRLNGKWRFNDLDIIEDSDAPECGWAVE